MQPVVADPPNYEYIPHDFIVLSLLTAILCGIFSPLSLVLTIPAVILSHKVCMYVSLSMYINILADALTIASCHKQLHDSNQVKLAYPSGQLETHPLMPRLVRFCMCNDPSARVDHSPLTCELQPCKQERRKVYCWTDYLSIVEHPVS